MNKITFKDFRQRKPVDCILDFSGEVSAYRRVCFTRHCMYTYDPVIVGSNKPKCGEWLIGVSAVVVLNPLIKDAREVHTVLFSPEDWDLLAKALKAGQTCSLKSAIIAYSPYADEVVIDKEDHYDFADGPGFTESMSHRYRPGYVVSASSLVLSSELDSAQKTNFEAESFGLPTSKDLIIDEKGKESEEQEEVYEEDWPGPAEPAPSLSDYYDDLEELELNTRGDGF